MSESMTKEEFCRRFVEHMVQRGGDEFEDGSSIRDYAEETAPTYWEQPRHRDEGPEACADVIMSFWGE